MIDCIMFLILVIWLAQGQLWATNEKAVSFIAQTNYVFH